MSAPVLTPISTLPLLHPQSASIPVLGYGTCQSRTCTQSALAALKSGYIHIDSAQIYRNESETGEAIAQSSIQHDKLFVCSKLWEDQYSRSGALNSVKSSCEKLGLQTIDLYLLHTPRPGPSARHQSWLGLQDAQAQGLVKTIGVSNWAPKHFDMLMSSGDVHVFPAVNQIEFHPWQQQKTIVEWCRANNVVVVAYSPLTQGHRLGDATIGEVAQKVGRTPAQVILRWCLQKGVVVIPKSDTESRIVENKNIFDFKLDSEDMQKIDALDEGQAANIGEWDPFAWE